MLEAIPTKERTPCERGLVDDVSEFIGNATDKSPLIGFVVLAFYGDGATQSGCWRPNAEDHGFGSTMFEAWAKETLISQFRYAGAAGAARDVLNGDT